MQLVTAGDASLSDVSQFPDGFPGFEGLWGVKWHLAGTFFRNMGLCDGEVIFSFRCSINKSF